MRIGILAAYVLMAVLTARRARAEDESHVRANELYRRGAAAALRGEHGEAYAAFAESYRLWPRSATLGNLGWAEVELGHVLVGFRHLKEALRASDLDTAKRTVIQANIDEVYGAIGHIAIEADEGARVTVDGVALAGGAPLREPIDVLPGRRELEASVGTRTHQATVDAPAGALVAVDLHAPPGPEAARPPADAVPPAPLSFAPPHEPNGDRSASGTWWSLPHAIAVGLGAAALVGAGVGLSFEAASHAAAADAGRLRASLGGGSCTAGAATAPCDGLRDKLHAVHSDETIAHVSLVVGGAAAVGAAIALLVGARAEQTDRSGLRWAAGPGAYVLEGEF